MSGRTITGTRKAHFRWRDGMRNTRKCRHNEGEFWRGDTEADALDKALERLEKMI